MKLIPSILVIAILFITGVKTLPIIYFNLGNSALKKENYVDAYKFYSKASTLAPSNEEYKYQYAVSLTKLKPSIRIQKEIFYLSEDKKSSKTARLARQQLIMWNRQIADNYRNNYIEQVPFETDILRWNQTTFPLKVAIDFPEGESIPEYYKNEISNAFTQWQNSTGFIKFSLDTTSLKKADIVVKFLPLPKSNCNSAGCKYVVAYTEPLIKNRQLKKMTITLYDKDAYGNYFSDKELYNTILHEIGHALGIMGHSYSTDDVMYMASTKESTTNIFTRFRSSFQYISAKDISTIRLLYNMTPTITNTPLSEIKSEGLIFAPVVLGSKEKMNNRKIKEAQNYVTKAPELPNGYIDLALAYAENGNQKKAEENLNKALGLSATTPNDKYIIYYNFAAINLNNNKPRKALQYANEALNIQNTEEIQDLISNINHALATNKEPFKNRIKKSNETQED